MRRNNQKTLGGISEFLLRAMAVPQMTSYSQSSPLSHQKLVTLSKVSLPSNALSSLNESLSPSGISLESLNHGSNHSDQCCPLNSPEDLPLHSHGPFEADIFSPTMKVESSDLCFFTVSGDKAGVHFPVFKTFVCG